MDAESPAPPRRPSVRLYVFSITVEWSQLGRELASVPAGESVCILTPHHLFPCERERVARLGADRCEFRTFHDLLDCADMEHCDGEADRQVVARHGKREGLVTEYYVAIKRLKNQRAAARLREEFEVLGGAVLCGDLGIAPGIWCELGLADRTSSACVPHSPLGSRIRRWFSDSAHCHYLDWEGQRWLLIGRPERVGQYLRKSAVTLRPLGRTAALWLNLQLNVLRKLRPGPRRSAPVLRILNLPWRLLNRSVSQLATAVHEDNVAVARLAEGLGLDYVNLQDSFLPGYYPSRYLLYRPAVRRFYVWDRFSQGIFNRHGLESRMWSAYQSWLLPALDPVAWKPVRRIVYLSSGAGDWTALKNRSDEDLVLALLVDVARLRPDLTIHYRPHPLWLHPEHQGVDSIQRVVECLEAFALPNIMVSQGARADGRGFSLTGNLSAVSSSVDEDIDGADLVLGEHSQTMLVAARRGKVIAGIDVSRHPPYFGDYARLGFPLVSSAPELINLIERMDRTDAGSGFLAEYNGAIMRHNRENCEGLTFA